MNNPLCSKWIFNLVIFLGFCIPSSLSAQDYLPFDSLEVSFNQLFATNRFNGVLAKYSNEKHLVFAKGSISGGNGSSLTENTPFLVPGMEQPLAALVTLKLMEQGKLNAKADCRKYFPELPYTGIMVLHLLTQQSGLPDYTTLYRQHRGPLDTLSLKGLPGLLKELCPPLLFKPGSSRQHSLTNDLLLILLAEKISGKNFDTLARELIFLPWGMHHTHWLNAPVQEIPGDFAQSFFWEDDQPKPVKPGIDAAMAIPMVYASGSDLMKFAGNFFANLSKSAYFQKILAKTTAIEKQGCRQNQSGKGFTLTGSRNGYDVLLTYNDSAKEAMLIQNSCCNPLSVSLALEWLSGKTPQVPETALISNIMLADGTGTMLRKASVRMEGQRILAVGNLKPFAGELVTDGAGKILAPGFIDTHSHLAGYLDDFPEALAALNQGVTTIVSGQDGGGDPVDSLKAMVERKPIAINLATYTGHTTLRRQAMGEGSLLCPATEAEIKKMQQALKGELQKGSLGLSTGLEYEGAFYSHRHEVLALARTTAAAKGRYMSHIRSEDISMHEAIDEIIELGREAGLPVLISHIKIALKDEWGTAPRLIATLQKARAEGVDITADCYPYDFWNSTLRVLFPAKNFTNPAAALFAAEHLFDPEGSVLVRFAPDTSYKGKTVGAIARLRNETPAQTLLYLVATAEKYAKDHPDASGIETIMGKSMTQEDIIPFLSWAHTNICSDGGNGGHPRGYGSFTRVLNHYVKELKIMGWETAIYKMTGLAAEHTGIRERGFIAPGYFADLVLIDPETVKDNADISDSKALSDGILKVWVNGSEVYADKKFLGNYPGVFVGK